MQSLTIVKIGGNIIENEAALQEMLTGFAAIPGAKILVHGGGRRADDICKKLDIEPQMVNGRRITDENTLEVVTMVYAGLLNKKVVSKLQALNCNAIGLSGADGNAILAHKRPVKDIDYGFAGDVDRVNTSLFQLLLAGRMTPVCCAITHDQKGQLLNTNADTIASTLATGLATMFKVRLLLCFEKEGVLSNPQDDSSVITHIYPETFEQYRADGTVSGGMLPKLENAFSAIRQGVQEVVICGPGWFRGESTGTVLSNK